MWHRPIAAPGPIGGRTLAFPTRMRRAPGWCSVNRCAWPRESHAPGTYPTHGATPCPTATGVTRAIAPAPRLRSQRRAQHAPPGLSARTRRKLPARRRQAAAGAERTAAARLPQARRRAPAEGIPPQDGGLHVHRRRRACRGAERGPRGDQGEGEGPRESPLSGCHYCSYRYR